MKPSVGPFPEGFLDITYDPSPTILRGTPQILAAIPEIDALRLRVGRHHDLSTDLHLILSRHNAHQRRPILVLLHRSGLLCAAAIFAERCILAVGIGLLRGGDQAGDGAVIAPDVDRRTALLAAMDALLASRACHTVTATLSGMIPTTSQHAMGAPSTAQSCYRPVRRYLPLGDSLETTLSRRFSSKKRRNLLYYRRSLFKTYDVEFVEEIPKTEVQQALLQLAQHSWPHRTPSEIGHHCSFLSSHPECFTMGLRLKTGIWLSIVTGWRIDGVTHMPWQLNHDGYKEESLMQVMRTCLIERECSSGQSALSWVGGTVSLQTACEPEFCLDILKSRPGPGSALLRYVLVPFLYKRNPQAFTGGSLMLLLSPQERSKAQTRLEPDS